MRLAAAHKEGDRPIATGPVANGRGGNIDTLVQRRSNDIGVERDTERVPVARTQARRRSHQRRHRYGQRHRWTAGARAAARWAASGCADYRRYRRGANERADEGKRIARGFAARPVERYAKCRQLADVEHDVHASHSFSGFFDAEENAGPAFARAAEPCEEAQILIRRVEHEPAAARAHRGPDQLAVLGLPL